ncbi:capsule biosynthesis protein, partial [Escherichia coli]|nr:capsule biosynthesis protein [Escherichia coli]
PQVVAIRSQISALQQQISSEKSKLTSPSTAKLNRSVADFEALKAKVEFSSDLYKLSLASLEKARLEASRKLKKLVVVQT